MTGQSLPGLKDLISKTTHWGYDVSSPVRVTQSPKKRFPISTRPGYNYNNCVNGSIRSKWNTSQQSRREFYDRPHSHSLPSLVDMRTNVYDSNNKVNSHSQKDSHRGAGVESNRNGTVAPHEVPPGEGGWLSFGTTTLKKIWTFYAKESSGHGVKNVVDPYRRRWLRGVWLIIVLVMLLVLVITVVDLLADYHNYTTVTRTDVTIQNRPEFPSVTICNNCPFKNLNRTTDNPMFTLMAKQTIISKYLTVNNSDPEVIKLLSKSVLEVYDSYSFTKRELFQFATYEERYLDIDTALETIDTPSGRCFTFNGPKYIAMHGVRQTNFDGRKSGLRLVININQNMYVPFEGLTAGIRLFISHHPETPRLEKDGLDVQPGTSTRVAVHPVKFKFLPYPFTSFGSEYCINVNDGDLTNKMVQSPFYSQQNCVFQCHMLQASKLCGCHSHALYVQSLPPCSFGMYLYCIMDKFSQMKDGYFNVSCDCPRSCTFTRYDSMLSGSQLPSTPAIHYLRKIVNASSSKELRENYLEVRVFLDSKLMRTESHEPRYTLSSIVGFLGGQMGFFMGASLMTIIELGETLIVTVIYYIHKLFQMGRMK